MFTIMEDEGYILKELLADGSVVSADIANEGTYTFTFENVSSDHTLTASFETAPDSDDPDDNGGGTCNVGTFTPLAALLLLPVLMTFKK